jgi:TPR repeat protein
MRLLKAIALGAALAPSMVSAQATTTQDGVQAFLREDYESATRILTPLAEDARNPDPIAQFFLASLYDSGQGAARNPFRACGLYMSAASRPHPLTQQARDIAEVIREPFASAPARDAACTTAATVSAPNRPPAAVTIDPGNPLRSVDAYARTQTAEGVNALLRGDYAGAVRILKPLAETPWQPDHAAEFFMAVLYEGGLGVAPDPLRGCGLFLRAAIDRGPLGAAAMELARARQRTLGREAFATCDRRASFGFDDRFEPVTFALDQEHWIAWDLNGATISYRGIERRVGLGLVDRHGRFVSIRHAALAGPNSSSTPRHFVDVFWWMPAQPHTWALWWRLFEVVRDELISVAVHELTTTPGEEPPAASTIDLSALVNLQANADGNPEYAILAGAAHRRSVIESDAERQEWKRFAAKELRARQAAPDGSRPRILDVYRQPALAYAAADGCEQVFVYGWTPDRTEVLAVRADRRVLPIAAGGTFDLATQTAGLEVSLHVYDRAMPSFPFCTDVGMGGLVEEVWRPIRGTVTIELAPTPFPVRAPHLYPATIRITGAQFVNRSGVRIDQTAPITLTAIVGAFFG